MNLYDMKNNAIQSPAIEYAATPKMGTTLLRDIKTREDLSLAYTPGIADVCKLIVQDESALRTHTFVRNNLAVISDGTAVLGLGNIGPKASYPVMEGKAMLFKRFGGIDAIPIIVHAKDDEELITTIENIADSFGAINLEDFAAPRCFHIEEELKKRLSIPVMHDDQQGTAVVVLAAVTNALTLFPHQQKDTKIVISGVGAAGVAVARLLIASGYSNVVMVDSKGIIGKHRTDLTSEKVELLKVTNQHNEQGTLAHALKRAGVFIGVSKGNLLKAEDIQRMDKDAIVIAMANPIPEIMPDVAKQAGAAIVATGRSDFENQVNNALAFPGIFRAAIDMNTKITQKMLVCAAQAIVAYHQDHLSASSLLPSILDDGVHLAIANALKANF
ncbi:NAD-dependent malic enzyme [Candidatus Cerribacteria bacterium 'Amazon FNV 2010 28 9']|uniref:NAD-dependent malic enzyme n=1 Tax=Candidatus Cerribacteria bacterium 'Amazon FNV 2010 28 9' TaxID=2081795 RepID=A0A317JQS8_9BACT|nr:MAG: NAD-dependent malic enzyme [Candidatus Cerribacteria bacterium 'Amazon FNV 2010 28 9']